MKKSVILIIAALVICVISRCSAATEKEPSIVYIHDTVTIEKIVYKKASPKKKQVAKKVTKPSTPSVPVYKISRKGKESIKRHEGLVLHKYRDSWGYSIGYGHFMGEIPNFEKISKAQADSLFEVDIKAVERSLNSLLVKNLDTKGYVFSQSFIDGLADLLYNSGHGNVERSQIYKDLQSKVRWGRDDKIIESDIRFLASKIRNFNITVPGHKARRLEESQLMASR